MRGTAAPDESRAAEIVGRECGKSLAGPLLYAEETSGVDFIGTRAGRTVSAEVTRFTDEGLRKDWAVAERARGADRVMLEKRLEVPLRTLERFCLDRYHGAIMAWWMNDVPELGEAVQLMRGERVVAAHVVSTSEHHPFCRLFIAPPAVGATAGRRPRSAPSRPTLPMRPTT